MLRVFRDAILPTLLFHVCMSIFWFSFFYEDAEVASLVLPVETVRYIWRVTYPPEVTDTSDSLIDTLNKIPWLRKWVSLFHLTVFLLRCPYIRCQQVHYHRVICVAPLLLGGIGWAVRLDWAKYSSVMMALLKGKISVDLNPHWIFDELNAAVVEWSRGIDFILIVWFCCSGRIPRLSL